MKLNWAIVLREITHFMYVYNYICTQAVKYTQKAKNSLYYLKKGLTLFLAEKVEFRKS